ncbi:hypothetical protein KKF84_06225 [Myxococcota bacterium]|nr:hypothetical protein [Myxococcota bacterium]MBU1534896.1 hypothetical protein [Myxococcota bacterium]
MQKHLLFLVIFLSSGCKIGSTGEAMIEYSLYARGTSQSASFTSTDGWDITLTEARLIVGPLLLCSHVPTFSKSGSDSLTECGKVMGDFDGATLFDALSDHEQFLGSLTGISGQINSIFYDHGYLWLPTQGEVQLVNDDLQGNSVTITGSATKDASTFDFVFSVPLIPIKKGLQTVMGVGVDFEGTPSTKKMVIQGDPAYWLRNVRFGPLYDMGTSPLILTEEMGTYNIVYYGLTTSAPLDFSWE